MFSYAALRSSYSDIGSQYLILLFTVLFFQFDYANATETFLLDYFLTSIIYRKICDLLLKVNSKKSALKTDFMIFLMLLLASVCGYLHCAMADYMGLCISCLRTAFLSATFSNAIPTNRNKRGFIDSSKSLPG